MNYDENLNKVIQKIEYNLKNKISYQELAQTIGTSSYTLQRIFVFLTGITLTDYIRKRRLSKAAEELIISDVKIIDLAYQYQYDSPVSFSNAFKKMHGISPQTLRKTKKSIKTFPPIYFTPVTDAGAELEYRIMEKDSWTLYGLTTGVIARENKKAIADLFQKAREIEILKDIIQNSNGKELYYGANQQSYDQEGNKKIQYYLLGTQKKHNWVEVKIPKATWACFKVNTKKQEDILKLYRTIYTKWLPSSGYKEILQYLDLEIYYEDTCEICIPVK